MKPNNKNKIKHYITNILCTALLGICLSIFYPFLPVYFQERHDTYVLVFLGIIVGTCIAGLIEIRKKDND